MKILSLDTSSATNVIGLVDGDKMLSDFAWEARDNSLEKVILHLDLALKRGNARLEDIHGIAVGIGPGSWTGVRVGVTVAKTLAYACGQPICGVTSLQAMAFQARDSTSLLIPLVDAGQDNVYAGFYRRSDNTVVSAGEYYVGGIEELAASLGEPALFLGKLAHVHRQTISRVAGSLATFGSPSDVHSGCDIAWLAWRRFERGDTDDAMALAPLYLKESLAQILLRKREQAGSSSEGLAC